eukprot:2184453-Pleurochrysis_carterae.AAC.1
MFLLSQSPHLFPVPLALPFLSMLVISRSARELFHVLPPMLSFLASPVVPQNHSWVEYWMQLPSTHMGRLFQYCRVLFGRSPPVPSLCVP